MQDNDLRGSLPSDPPLAELRRTVKKYGAVTALDGVDFAVRRGEVVALLGPNGAGKTTAVHLLLGLLRPSAGEVRLFGREPHDAEARVRVGAMLQISKVPETLKVREHVELISSYYPHPMAPAEIYAAAGLGGLEERLFGKLSGGQKQRVLFALAICGGPDLLFLDEPTVGLDVESRRGLWHEIEMRAEAGCSVLLTTHHIEEADALADRIVLINRGRIVAQGTPSEIKARVSGRTIRCRSALSPSELARLPGVTSVRQSGERVELLASDADRALRELVLRDPQVSGIEVKGADLEEAFLTLTADENDGDKREVAA
jgi:ABC-2 type transport system ATP-binding protein